VQAHIASKLPKQPTPAPSPSPEPEPGPHPSGSTTMEHAQDLPSCASFTAPDEDEQPAWRCDINHALGRYYLAGDKRSCPGCGSNKEGKGKHAVMDFWLPRGVVVRQEVDVLGWKPRRPYRVREPRTGDESAAKQDGVHTSTTDYESKASLGRVSIPRAIAPDEDVSAPVASTGASGKRKHPVAPTHNQFASRRYWDAIEWGLEGDEALERALKETEEWVDGRGEEVSKVDDDDEVDKRREGGKERAKGQDGEQEVTRREKQKFTPRSLTLPMSGKKRHQEKQHIYPALTSSLALNALRSRRGPYFPPDGRGNGEMHYGDGDEEKGQYATDSDTERKRLQIRAQALGSAHDTVCEGEGSTQNRRAGMEGQDMSTLCESSEEEGSTSGSDSN